MPVALYVVVVGPDIAERGCGMTREALGEFQHMVRLAILQLGDGVSGVPHSSSATWDVAHLKYLHSVVAVVRDVHLSRRVDRDVPDVLELAVAETA